MNNDEKPTDEGCAGLDLSTAEKEAPDQLSPLEQRMKALEARIDLLDTVQRETLKKIEEELTPQLQNGMGQIHQMIHQLAVKVNSIDPKRPLLEVTLCQNDPEIAGPTMRKFKVSLLPETHPDPKRAGHADVLELAEDENTKESSWVPITLMPALQEYTTALLKVRKISAGVYGWMRIKEIARPQGNTDDFIEGDDDTLPAAANDEASTEASQTAATA